MIGLHSKGINQKFFVNMDQTAIYFDSKTRTTVSERGERTVSIRSDSSSKRITLSVAVAYDGTKLPLFVVFKGQPNGRIEQDLPNILPAGMYGCCQKNAWMDERACLLWVDKVWKPYVAGTSKSLLLLDDFKCHKQRAFASRLDVLGTTLSLIPGGYTCVLQPCDVGINKPLKDRVRATCAKWKSEKYASLGPTDTVPTPSRQELCQWLREAWADISTSVVCNAFRGAGYVDSIIDSNVDWLATESDDSSDDE